MALRISYTIDAENDLDAIFSYIADDNRNAAMGLLERMERAIAALAENPRLGAVLQLDDEYSPVLCYRHYYVAPYQIFYRFTEADLFVIRVIHNKRDWLHLLFEG